MQWFVGSVSNAIAESKRTGSVFVVYIEDGGEESNKMDTVWSNEQISAVLSRDCIAIRVDVNSVEGRQFSSIYPVVCVPCTYFIDGNGVPAEVIGGAVSAEQLLDKAKQAIQNHRIKFPKLEAESLPSTSSPSASPSQALSSQNDLPGGQRNESSPELTERVARAKKLIEEKRKEKQEKEKEDAQRKEIERRKQGQQITKARMDREEKLVQQMAERVRLEKVKDKAAREAIREKIAQDKAERAAREEIERKERHNVAARIDPQLSANDTAVECSIVRIQFRLPDGSSITQNFPPDAVLETARRFIGSSSGNSSRDFGGSTGLSLSSAITWLLAPLLALVSFLKLLLFSSPQQPSRGTVQGSSGQSTNAANQSFSSSPTSEVRRRTKESGNNQETFKKEGKIHSFKQDDNGDDENNTWNGNSTQQM